MKIICRELALERMPDDFRIIFTVESPNPQGNIGLTKHVKGTGIQEENDTTFLSIGEAVKLAGMLLKAAK